MSEKNPIHAAMVDVMGDVRSVRKGERNSDQGYVATRPREMS